MSSHPSPDDLVAPSFGSAMRRDYVSLILRKMAQTSTAQRKLADTTGISKSRLGVLLHRDPSKRAAMTVAEFEIILGALGTNVVQAFIGLETLAHGAEPDDRRYRSLIPMLCECFVSLPRRLIEALEGLDGLDGSEVRREWAFPLQNVLIKKVREEVVAVTDRRARLAQSEEFHL